MNKDEKMRATASNATQKPRGHFTHVFLVSNLFVVGLMIGVTVLIDHMHNAMAVSHKKEEVVNRVVTIKPLKIVAIGDSITYGATLEEATRKENAYPTQLESLLGNGSRVYNYGQSGATLLDSGDIPYTKDETYASVQDQHPDVVLIMLGTNDSKTINWNQEEYAAELADLVDSYKNLSSKPKVYLLTIPPAYGHYSETDVNEQTAANEVVPTIRQVAKATDTSLIDIYNVFKDKPELLYDGIHPTAEGYKVIAETIYKTIEGGNLL